MSTKATKNYYPVYFDWIDLEGIADTKRRKTQYYTLVLGVTALPSAIFRFDELNDAYAEIYIPKTVDLSVPAPGIERVMAVVPAENFVPDAMSRSVYEEWVGANCDGIKLIATGDSKF